MTKRTRGASNARSKRSVLFKQAVRGYSIGCCISGDPLRDDEDAHAHLTGSEPKWAVGFICAKSLKALRGALAEELAHLAANQGHTEPWRREMRRLGARIPAHGRRKPRS